ncbi:UvrD-helicase domain-containing protein [Glycomyces rhizosphaerae]|uniref:DNA 3'-5' helicase n=1 Tax=Glycomyces rhizosphaerae TaxID=2054422 RepID=A0ABV7Q514_9ACTN
MSGNADVALYLPKQLNRRLRKLPPEVRELTTSFFAKFNEDFRRNAIHLEPIRQVKDRRLRTARLNQAWRAILLQADDQEFVLLDVAPHDEAYRRIKVISWGVNPTFANFEVSYLDELQLPVQAQALGSPAAERHSAGVFDPYTDAQLSELGIRPELLPALRPLATEEEVLALAEGLDDRIAQIVVDLASGVAYETVMDQITRPGASSDEIDVSDIAAALRNPASQVTSTDAAVAKMIDAGFEAWQLFLHPDQRKLVDRSYNGPARVAGGPGTGKTVVALHRTARLARALEVGGNDRILLTTYNKRLKSDLERRLGKLLDDAARARVDVVNIDRLALDIARELTGERRRPVWNDDELRDLWQQVLDAADETGFEAAFLLEEWREVILAGFITSKSAYLAAERPGRGTRLGKAQRARVWDLVERYLALLTAEQVWSGEQICMAAALAENARAWTGKRRYRHIVVDEAQDLSAVHWRLLRMLCPETTDDLFIAGDNFQRIYRQPLRMAPLGIDIQGRSRNLTLSYRTTRQILDKAMLVMSDAEADPVDEDATDLSGYRSVLSGAEPRFLPQRDERSEMRAVIDQVLSWADRGAERNSIVVCMPNAKSVPRYVDALQAAGVPAVAVRDDIPEGDSVHVTTINGLKGTEYHRVVLTEVGADRYPRRFATSLADADPVAHAQALERERNLLFVAFTRACRDLTVVWSGEPSPLLRQG